ncbi:MAG: sugar phosphate isomerase/epimerase [Planctomycetes bacterium]|nr:sugar phosphate isomerase/epimerase [Planctomycetota bacterium]
MAMRVGFSTICCPTWDLKTVFEHAVRLGFDGLEFRGLQGELHLPNHVELARNGDVLFEVCQKTNVELVCLGTSASFGSRDKQVLGDNKAVVREHVELAQSLHCPYVRVFTGDIPGGSNRLGTLGRIVEALADLTHFAVRRKVTLLIENSGELSSSKDLWFVLDAVQHPGLAACWNPVNGLSIGDRASIAIPRLGSQLGLVHITDAAFAGSSMEGYQPLGEGDVDIPTLVELLTGITYDGYLMVEWPKLWDNSLADAETVLPKSVEYLRGLLNVERKPLSAYKGDKSPVTFADRRPSVSSQT